VVESQTTRKPRFGSEGASLAPDKVEPSNFARGSSRKHCSDTFE
jgi:hypothetical protein